MKLKTPKQVRTMREKSKQAAIDETKRLQQRRLDADERKFLNEFREIWEWASSYWQSLMSNWVWNTHFIFLQSLNILFLITTKSIELYRLENQ